MRHPMECYEEKLAHDACFYKWYHDEFLKGTARNEQPCDALFKTYRACVGKKMEAAGVGYVMDKRLDEKLDERERNAK